MLRIEKDCCPFITVSVSTRVPNETAPTAFLSLAKTAPRVSKRVPNETAPARQHFLLDEPHARTRALSAVYTCARCTR